MTTYAHEPFRTKPTREQALAIAARRKAARQRRTSRIRRFVAALAVAVFVAPFGVIYTQMADGRDPAPATVAHVSTSTSTSSGSITSDSTSPAPVTTQQS